MIIDTIPFSTGEDGEGRRGDDEEESEDEAPAPSVCRPGTPPPAQASDEMRYGSAALRDNNRLVLL
jgi:hypothetical protein